MKTSRWLGAALLVALLAGGGWWFFVRVPEPVVTFRLKSFLFIKWIRQEGISL